MTSLRLPGESRHWLNMEFCWKSSAVGFLSSLFIFTYTEGLIRYNTALFYFYVFCFILLEINLKQLQDTAVTVELFVCTGD